MMDKLIALDKELALHDGESVKKLRREIRKKISDGDIDALYLEMVQNIVEHLNTVVDSEQE